MAQPEALFLWAVDMLTQKELKRIWNYCPTTGLFTRLVATSPNTKVGDIANHRQSSGYIQIMVNNKPYLAHRLAWLYMTGEWPKGDIDHKFGIRDDNRWSELRDVTRSINLQNQRRLRIDNKSGYAGVYLRKEKNKWGACININGKNVHLGVFESAYEAGAYRLQKKRELHEGCTI